MRSLKAIQTDLHKLADELCDIQNHYEKLHDKVNIENEKEDEKGDLYYELIGASEEASVSLSDAIDMLSDGVDFETDLEDLKRSSNAAL